MWVFMTVVSMDSLLRVFAKWHIYDNTARADAVAFALLLFAFPARLILDFHRGKHMETEQVVLFAYMVLLLITILGH